MQLNRCWVVLYAVLACGRYLQAFKLPVSRLCGSTIRPRLLSEQKTAYRASSDLTHFLTLVDEGLRDGNAKSISLYDARVSRTSTAPGLELLHKVRRVDGRMVVIRSTTKLQLTHKYDHSEQAKNYDITQAGKLIKNILDSGVFRQASLDTPQQVHKLRVGGTVQAPTYRLVSRAKTSSDSDSTPCEVTLLAHDRTKAGFVSTNEPFLQALGITYTDHGANKKKSLAGTQSTTETATAATTSPSVTTVSTARPRVGMSDKLHQIQKYVEILDGLVRDQYCTVNCITAEPAGSAPTAASATASVTHDPSKQPLNILDMGCGLAYLTFAVHSHFRKQFPALHTTGIEVRPELVQQTESIARSLGPAFNGLHFNEGRIMDLLYNISVVHRAGHNKHPNKLEVKVSHDRSNRTSDDDVLSNILALPTEPAPTAAQVPPVDILLALHACDTATDDAICYGIRANASIIVVAPCCHKQLRPQLDAHVRKVLSTRTATVSSEAGTKDASNIQTTLALSEVLTHGIYRERQAEMVTDTLRALYLQYAGYDTKVFQFVSGTHTAKNIMITATRSAQNKVSTAQDRDALRSRIQELKRAYGIRDHKLEHLLKLDGRQSV